MADKPTRDGFGEGLVELGEKNPNVVALSGDLEDSARAIWFKQRFPQRFFSVGIAEQDMIGTAAGLAMAGKIPFACSFAQFVTAKTLEQLRMAVCYQKLPVKTVGSHGGLSVGADGATAEALEDIAHMRNLPHMAVVVPCDAQEAKQAAFAAAEWNGPIYLRLGRAPAPTITKADAEFRIGRASVLRDGGDVTLIACGLMVAHSLQAADALSKDGVQARVINLHTIKPLDADTILKAARDTGAIVTAEEHSVIGGLGGAVAELLAQEHPTPVRMVGVQDRFGTSGDPNDLLKAFHLMPDDIAAAAKAVLKLKTHAVG